MGTKTRRILVCAFLVGVWIGVSLYALPIPSPLNGIIGGVASVLMGYMFYHSATDTALTFGSKWSGRLVCFVLAFWSIALCSYGASQNFWMAAIAYTGMFVVWVMIAALEHTNMPTEPEEIHEWKKG